MSQSSHIVFKWRLPWFTFCLVPLTLWPFFMFDYDKFYWFYWCFCGGVDPWSSQPSIFADFITKPHIYNFILLIGLFSSVKFSLSRVRLCDPMDCRTPGLPVHHQLPEFTQTHVHWVSDAIQPSHSLSSPSPPAFNLSQHQGLFKLVSSLHQMAKILEFQL